MGQAVSSSGEHDIPAFDAAIGDDAPAAAGGEEKKETAASDAPAAGIISSPPAANGEKKKTRTLRMSQAEVDRILAYRPEPLPSIPDHPPADLELPEHVKAELAEAMSEATMLIHQINESHLYQQELVREQLEEKGYVEYELSDDSVSEEDYNGGGGIEEVVIVHRRGRRWYRPGVKKTAAGSVKRVS